MTGASGSRIGRIGLALSGVSVLLTFTVAVLGPSLMEPALPGRPGQPPWSVAGHPSPYLVVALTAAAIAAGTAGLALTIRAGRRGWQVAPGLLLAAGIVAAVGLALVPPFGSSDHLSYAAYGRMVITGHDPYTTTPAALARLGDPVARAVQDWRSSPSVYGALATAGQALASSVGGTSVRLTVFVLSLLNVTAYALAGLLLHWLARGDRRRQLRAALLWTANPLLLQVLVAGAHVDSQATLFAVAAVAAFCLGRPAGSARGPADSVRGAARSVLGPASGGPARPAAELRPVTPPPAGQGRMLLAAASAGALVGLGFAVKATMVLVGLGLALACWLASRAPVRRGRGQLAVLAALAAGFAVTAGASLAIWGLTSLRPALHAGSYVSIGSPWRAVRSALRLVTGEAAAEEVVKVAAILLAAGLLLLMLRSIARASPALAAAALVTSVVAAVALAWLFAWPYVLPWYDALGWALLALLPWSRLDWLLLARTSALAIGYLPARGTVILPAGLGWLETVVRTAVTPALLTIAVVTLIVTLWPGRGWTWPGERQWPETIPSRPQESEPGLEVRPGAV